ncbi:TetR family transcriptional regulator C-terminal domain-containing protein, partial [Haladaptatus sp.]|uniref:TetR family transcriptional regulator C-terminal domain-containing protein n=1 Tax=Haladaptatus sp. TaxID=1973141 RepID=UPI003C35D15C
NNDRLRGLFADIIARGIERGEFEEDIDPERAAERLLIFLDGVRGRGVVLGSNDPNEVGREVIDEFVDDICAGGDE